MNGVFLGFLPDEGDAGGSSETIGQLNDLLGAKAATIGWYAQAQSGTTFDGSQILGVMDQVVASGAILEAAIMPTKGWQGLTSDDDSQAQAICAVMKKFTDKGVDVRLRFGHEVNYYQTDGTYTGTASDFKAGWATVANACKSNSKVKMFFTPNIANLDQYKQYFPDDPSTVDLIGIDYYPQDPSASFLDAMQPFYDYGKSLNKNIQFAIGETGLGSGDDINSRLQWLGSIMSAETKKAMPDFVSCTWFNYNKGYNFKLVDENDSATTSATKSFLKI